MLTYSLQFCRCIFPLRPEMQNTVEPSFIPLWFTYILVLCLLQFGIILARTQTTTATILFFSNVKSQMTAVQYVSFAMLAPLRIFHIENSLI